MPRIIDNSDIMKILSNRIMESSTSAAAKDLGFSQVYIWEVWRGKKKVSPRLAKELGFEPILGTFKKI